jgi:hypothetical protein
MEAANEKDPVATLASATTCGLTRKEKRRKLPKHELGILAPHIPERFQRKLVLSISADR